jgi:DNA-binding XRE family transcriptional regulator
MFQDIIKKSLSGLTNEMLENKKPLLEILNNLNLTEDLKVYLIIKSGQWLDLLGDSVFRETFDPCTKHELVLKGLLGNLKINNQTLNLITNAYEDPTSTISYDYAMLFIENTEQVFALSDINLSNGTNI